MTISNSSRPIARVFGQLLRRDAEMNCSKDFTPRLRLWSTVRWGAPEVVFESIWRDLDAVKAAFGDAWQQLSW